MTEHIKPAYASLIGISTHGRTHREHISSARTHLEAIAAKLDVDLSDVKPADEICDAEFFIITLMRLVRSKSPKITCLLGFLERDLHDARDC